MLLDCSKSKPMHYLLNLKCWFFMSVPILNNNFHISNTILIIVSNLTMETFSFTHTQQRAQFFSKLAASNHISNDFSFPEGVFNHVEQATQKFETNKVFSSKGQINHGYTLPLSETKKFNEQMAEELAKLEEVDPHNIYLHAAKESLQKLRNLMEGLCQMERTQKRGFFFIFLVSIIVTLTTVHATGQFSNGDVTDKILEDKKEVQKLEKMKDQLLEEQIVKLQNKTSALEKELQKQELEQGRNDFAFTIQKYTEEVFQSLLIMINPEEYDYSDSQFLQHVEQVALKYMKNLDNDASAFNPTNFLLGISRSYSLILSGSEDRLCEHSKLLTIFESIIPNQDFEGTKTENKYKYSLPGNKYLWVNPKMILPPSKFRPSSFSLQRTIVSDHNIQVKPFNNTLFYIQSSKAFSATIQCPNETKSMILYPNPVLKLQLHCQLQSVHLNVSSYKIETNFEDVQVEYGKVNEDTLVYHPDLPQEIDEELMSEYIDRLYNIRDHIRQEEMEKLHNRQILQELDDGIKGIFDSIWSIFSTPAHIIMGALGLIMGLTFIICIVLCVFKLR